MNSLKIFKSSFFVAALSIVPAVSVAQTSVFSENFDAGLTPGANFSKYVFGDTDATTSTDAIAAGVGIAGTPGWQIINNCPSGNAGFSGIGAQYQNGGVTANTSANLSDYFLSFDARATAGSLNIQIQTWTGHGFGGTMTGTLTTAPTPPGFGNDQVLTPGFTHYNLNLGDTNVFKGGSVNMTGGTIQVAMQFDGGGPTPYQNTLIVDNFALTMVPEPSSFALVAVASVSLLFVRRRGFRIS